MSSWEDKLDYAMRDPAFLGHGEFARSLWLLRHPAVCKVRYEDLVGPRGGGTAGAQLDAVTRLVGHVGADVDPLQVAAKIYDPGSWSFHQGRTGAWRDHFTERNLARFRGRIQRRRFGVRLRVMRPAFLFLGGFKVLCRNRLYLAEAHRRGLAPLLITSADWRDRTVAAMADPDHPAAELAAAAFVAGEVEVEGSFTAGKSARPGSRPGLGHPRGVRGGRDDGRADRRARRRARPAPPGLRATRACRSKYLQRLLCPDWSPPVLLLPPGDRSTRHGTHPGFPAVLKPASRRSSSGVRRVGSQRELDEVLPDYPAAETLLLEQYVAGPEFSVESLLQNGTVIFDSVTRKVTNEETTERFVELGHSVPAAPGPLVDALLATSRAVLDRLAFAEGVAHAEFRVRPDGGVVLMEIAARTPGDGILPLYHLATGQPMEPQIMRIALGEPAAYPVPTRVARQVYVDHRPGVSTRSGWPGPAWSRGGCPADCGRCRCRAGRMILRRCGGAGARRPWRPAGPAVRVRRPGGDLPARCPDGGRAGQLERDVRAALDVRVAESAGGRIR